jgi:hypothetical protein
MSSVESHSAEASAPTPGAEPPEATKTAPDATRAVVLLISGEKIVKRVTGPVPLNIADAADWQPNREAIEQRYQWLSRTMETDALIKLAFDIMRL